MADNNLTLRSITAPGLGQAGYGQQMEKVFQNIDDNFKIVGNREFIKGDKGYSLKSEAIPLVENGLLTKTGAGVLKAILSLRVDATKGEDASFAEGLVGHPITEVRNTVSQRVSGALSINNVNMLDYFGEVEYEVDGKTQKQIQMFNIIKVYDPANPSDEQIIGATNDIVFRDARFVKLSDNINEAEYSDRYDYTCTVHLVLKEVIVDQDSQASAEVLCCEVLQNYPTLYYDKGAGTFCWRIFGVESGIIARGPKGDDGRDAKMHFVRVKYSDSQDVAPSGIDLSPDGGETYIISHVLEEGRWKKVGESGSDGISQETVNGWAGDACVAFMQVTKSIDAASSTTTTTNNSPHIDTPSLDNSGFNAGSTIQQPANDNQTPGGSGSTITPPWMSGGSGFARKVTTGLSGNRLPGASLNTTNTNSEYPVAFMGHIIIETVGNEQVACVFCGGSNCIQVQENSAIVRSALFGISFTEGANLNSIFVPILQKNSLDESPVHAIWAVGSKNSMDNGKTELHITPFDKYKLIRDVGDTLSKTSEATYEEPSKRLKTLRDKIYYDTKSKTKLNIDYPQVIISSLYGETGTQDIKNPTATLFIGTAYAESLIDTSSTSTDVKYLDVPRLNLGDKGVVQIGASSKNDRVNNNKGSLVVANIYSSLNALAQSNDGGCPLNLIGTNGTVNLGDPSASGTGTINAYGSLNVHKNISVTSDADIKGDASIHGDVKIYDTSNTTQKILLNRSNGVDIFSDLPRLSLVDYTDDNNFSALRTKYKNGTLSLGFEKIVDGGSPGAGDSIVPAIETNAQYIQLGDNVRISQSYASSASLRKTARFILSHWSDDADPVTADIYIKSAGSNLNEDKSIQAGDSDNNPWESAWIVAFCIQDNTSLKTGTVSPVLNTGVTLKFDVTRKYSTGWSHTIKTSARTMFAYLQACCNDSLQYNAPGSEWVTISDTLSDYQLIDVNYSHDGICDYSNKSYKSTHTFNFKLNKNFTTTVKDSNHIRIRCCIQLYDNLAGTGTWGIGSLGHHYSKDSYVKLTNYDSSNIQFKNTSKGRSSTEPVAKYYNGMILLGANQHRNIGLYSTVGADVSSGNNNKKYGIFMSFDKIDFGNNKIGNGIVFIPAEAIYKACYDCLPTEASGSLVNGTPNSGNPRNDLGPGVIYFTEDGINVPPDDSAAGAWANNQDNVVWM